MLNIDTTHCEDGIVEVRVTGKLHKEDLLEKLEPVLDELIEKRDTINGLMIDATDFEGWDGLSTIMSHMGVVHRHHKLIKRVAVCGNKKWQKMLPKFSNVFLKPELKYFDGENAAADARNWLGEMVSEKEWEEHEKTEHHQHVE